MRWKLPLVETIVVCVIVGFGCCIALPELASARSHAQRATCQMNVKQIVLAYQQYLQDSQRVSPPISASDKGWADLLQTYARDWAVFQCPSGYANNPRQTDYFYNARLAKVRKVPFPSLTFAFGDGYDNGGANSHLLETALDWRSGYRNERTGRHLDGLNFAFVDGHVKWYRPEKISNQPPDYMPTFAAR